MTHEEQNIAIAQACGYSEHPTKSEWLIPGGENYRHYSAYWICESELPNYAGSLDAMHEAEKTLENKDAYGVHLRAVVQQQAGESYFKTFCATAAQRAEAFLRTLSIDPTL